MLKVKPDDYKGLSREDKANYYAASLLVKSTKNILITSEYYYPRLDQG